PDATWSKGETCYHDRFGVGSVLSTDGERVTVLLKSGETKKILAHFLMATTEVWNPADTPPAPKVRPAPKAANDNRPIAVIDGETLFNLTFPPVDYVIPQYITEGLTILAGRPKLGKSWLALGMCIAVATGGNVLGEDCEQGDAL